MLAIFSILIAVVDNYTRAFINVRSNIALVLHPVYVFAEFPYEIVRNTEVFFTPRFELLDENKNLRSRNLKLQQMVMHYLSLEEENRRMRSLLSISDSLPFETKLARIVGIVPGSMSRLLINSGASDGIKENQAVVGRNSLVGRVVEVNAVSSQILLITDHDSAVPIQIRRNKFRSILGGTGDLDSMVLENVPTSTEIFVGDSVETSGLGDLFPAGYPVGKVSSFKLEDTSPYAMVSVEPLLELDDIRDVLVIVE
jgi:rod shape-determining protein MreC